MHRLFQFKLSYIKVFTANIPGAGAGAPKAGAGAGEPKPKVEGAGAGVLPKPPGAGVLPNKPKQMEKLQVISK